MSQNRTALAMAEQKMREARQWWATWELEIHRYRCWALLYVSRKRMLDALPDVPFQYGGVVESLADSIDVAHDRLLVSSEGIVSAARAARSCELMAQIFYEEYEERETTVEQVERMVLTLEQDLATMERSLKKWGG